MRNGQRKIRITVTKKDTEKCSPPKKKSWNNKKKHGVDQEGARRRKPLMRRRPGSLGAIQWREARTIGRALASNAQVGEEIIHQRSIRQGIKGTDSTQPAPAKYGGHSYQCNY